MSIQAAITRIEGDVRTEVTDLIAKARGVVEHGEALLATHLPGIETDIRAIEADPFVKAYLGANLAVPEHLVNVGLDFLTKLVTAWQQDHPAPATTPETGPIGIDAQPDTPPAP